jgi:hypothetical protein
MALRALTFTDPAPSSATASVVQQLEQRVNGTGQKKVNEINYQTHCAAEINCLGLFALGQRVQKNNQTAENL